MKDIHSFALKNNFHAYLLIIVNNHSLKFLGTSAKHSWNNIFMLIGKGIILLFNVSRIQNINKAIWMEQAKYSKVGRKCVRLILWANTVQFRTVWKYFPNWIYRVYNLYYYRWYYGIKNNVRRKCFVFHCSVDIKKKTLDWLPMYLFNHSQY